jgi:hypothetical protein
MFRNAHTRLLAAALLMAGACSSLPAQSTNTPSRDTISKSEIRDISITGPQADSPFYTERQEAKAALAEAGREGYGMYVPKPPRPPAGQQMKKFFKGMFGSLKFGKGTGGSTPMVLSVEPSAFSLSQTPELDVSVKISNARKHEIEILYPNDQRLEVVTKDAAGIVIGRWSEDRAFQPTKGFVEINPEEFIIYAERIPTSRMKAGETYTIEASLANQEGYTATATVTPQP